MKTKIGVFSLIIGFLLLAAALGLFLYNEYEQDQAGKAVEMVMPHLVDAINERKESGQAETMIDVMPNPPEEEKKEMAVVEVDGKGYIGFVGLSSLKLELPVIADWNYDDLNKSPCRYSGSTYSDDLVIMAHNYDKHFGRIADLRKGEVITFTDMNGETIRYVVIATDVLASTDIEDMTAGEYDLTLFTCDYSGNNRITVRCDRFE